jgi:arylsulfatase A-like enzyme
MRTTLAEEMRAAGYRTAAFVTGPWMNRAFGLDQGFDDYANTSILEETAFREGDATRPLPETHLRSHREVTGLEIASRAIEWLEGNGDHPFFLFLHFWDVHYDYTPPPPYDAVFDPDYEGAIDGRDFVTNPGVHAGMDVRDLRHVLALYDGEVRFTDRNIDSVIERLTELGLLDRTLVVVTADHGDEFFEHGGKGHNQSLYDEVIVVPLVMRWPAGIPRGRVVSTPVRLIDIYPTILDLVGLPPGKEAMGRSLASSITGVGNPPVPPAYCDLFLLSEHRYQALRSARSKAVAKIEDDLVRTAVFDLVRDPREHRPVHPTAGEPLGGVVEALREAANAVERLGRSLPRTGGEAVELDERELQLLRELGYVR